MKSVVFFVLLVLFSFGCRNEFELEAPYRDIPVVYGYLSQQDEDHFIRVEKAFLEPGGDAEVIAQIADSIYYGPDAVTVTLTNLRTDNTVTLERVNGEDFGLERTEGAFADRPNILYRGTQQALQLRGGDRVLLTVERPGEEPATAMTRMLGEIVSSITGPPDQISMGLYDRNTNISFETGDAARVFDIRMFLSIRERYPSDPSRNRDLRLEWVLTDRFIPDEDNRTKTYQFEHLRFYQFLVNQLPVDPNVIRIFDGIELQISAAGNEVAEALRVATANQGITSSPALPTYSNIENGRGILTSRYQILRTGLDLTRATRDSLVRGIYTKDLGFQ
jgi:hypothetical protein